MEKTNNLKGFDAINRAKSLMTESTQPKSVENKNFKLIKEGADGRVYAIVKENAKYFIKRSMSNHVNGFDYLLGPTRKGSFMFESFAKATNSLNNILVGLNENYGDDECKGKKDLLTSDVALDEEEVMMGDDLEINEEEEVALEEAIDVDNMLSEIDAEEEMSGEFLAELDDIEEYINETLSEKYVLKIDSPKTDIPAEDDADMDFDMDFEGEDDSNTDFESEGEDDFGGDDEGDENPFGEPFDAGVEASEDEDPKKFLQQLAGKLATSLRDYQDANSDDIETKKFVANSILSAVDTEGMESSDIEDIKKKLEEAPDSEGDEVENDDAPAEEEGGDDMDFDMDFEGEDDDAPAEEEEPLDEDFDPDTDDIVKHLSDGFNKTPSKRKYEETPEQKARKEKYKKMDLSLPVDHPVNKVFENFNQNLDEYLASMVNPGIFGDEENTQKSKEMTTEKPAVKPTTTPTETPSRRKAPFQTPQVKPQPKFGK